MAKSKNESSATGDRGLVAMIQKDYAHNYPKNAIWHITSDGSVFLDSDQRLAEMHQSTLMDGELVTIKTE